MNNSVQPLVVKQLVDSAVESLSVPEQTVANKRFPDEVSRAVSSFCDRNGNSYPGRYAFPVR